MDPRTARVVHDTFPLAGASARAIAIGPGQVWVAGVAGGILVRLDARTGAVEAITPTTRGAIAIFWGVAVSGDEVWASDTGDDLVWKIDPALTAATTSVQVGRGPDGIAIGGGSVWVANYYDGTISRIDPASRRVSATVQVGPNPTDVAVGAGGVWITFGGRAP